MTAIHCATCYRNGFPKPDACPFPQFRNDEHCKKYRKGSAPPAATDGARVVVEPEPQVPMAPEPRNPKTPETQKRPIYFRLDQIKWLAKEELRREEAEMPYERRTMSAIVREALDCLMKESQ